MVKFLVNEVEIMRTGENIFRRKDGRWEARYIVGYTEQGKAKYRSIYAKTYAEVKAKLQACILELESNVVTTNIIFTEVAKQWLNKVKSEVKESTHAHYYQTVNKHLINAFGGIQIKKINSNMISNFFNALNLSSKTKSDICVITKQIFQYALSEKYISKLPQFPKLNVSQSDVEIFTDFEQKKLEKYLFENINFLNLGIAITLYTGIRIGELCALKKEDFDFLNNTMSINKTMQRVKNLDKSISSKTKIIIDTAKTQKSIRVLPIPRFLIELTKKYYACLSNNFFILTGTKDYIEPRLLEYKFKKILKDLYIKSYCFHTLRHTFATNCVRNGVDIKTLSELLGHSSVKITLERYVHSDLNLKKREIEKLSSPIYGQNFGQMYNDIAYCQAL